jgi:hypothetical protein
VTFPPLSASDSSTTETSHARLRRRHQGVGDLSHSSVLLGGLAVAVAGKNLPTCGKRKGLFPSSYAAWRPLECGIAGCGKGGGEHTRVGFPRSSCTIARLAARNTEDARPHVGPALAGHTAAQVHQQVRSPLAQMPAYTEEKLSDVDLEAIAAYIAGLEPTEQHMEPVKLSEVVAIHHWMVIGAIAARDRGDALHHVGHIIEAVRGEHLAAMKRARALLREGELHEAEHLIEEMLAGKAKPELSREMLSLRLALSAIDQRNRAEAIHQMRHFLAGATGADRKKGEAVLAHLREGDLHDAEHGIADLLGIEPH